MAWYNAGTVAVANNSPTVTGAGTAWADYVDAGQSFIGPDGLAYEILSVVSATQLTLASNYRGATAAGQAYRVMPVQGYLRELAIQANQLVQSFAAVRDGIGAGKFPDGLVGTPGFRFANDEDTGFYRPGANLLGIVTNGAERIRVDASGNVGIGTASPGSKLDVAGKLRLSGGEDNQLEWVNNGQTWRFSSSTAGRLYLYDVTGSKFPFGIAAGAPNDSFTITNTGSVGIGTSAPGAKLHIAGDTISTTSYIVGGNADGWGRIATAASSLYIQSGSSNGGSSNANTIVFGNMYGQSGAGAVRPGQDNLALLGTGTYRWNVVYAATGAINTSDERAKQDIAPVPEEWLDAWGELEWVRYKFKDAADEKGSDARWHVGLIAQRVRDAFAARSLDATEIGLLCYDEWEEEREPILEERQVDTEIVILDRVDTGLFDAEGNPVFRDVTEERPVMGMVDTGETRVTLEAGDRWGLRYDECQAMEAAWQRRELARLRQAAESRTAAAEAEIAARKESEAELRAAHDAELAAALARITALEGGTS